MEDQKDLPLIPCSECQGQASYRPPLLVGYSTPFEALLHYRFGSTMASMRFRILPAKAAEGTPPRAAEPPIGLSM